MNFLPPGGVADYVVTGSWGEKAQEEAAALGQARIAASTKAGNYNRVPRNDEIGSEPDAGLRPLHHQRNDSGR